MINLKEIFKFNFRVYFSSRWKAWRRHNKVALSLASELPVTEEEQKSTVSGEQNTVEDEHIESDNFIEGISEAENSFWGIPVELPSILSSESDLESQSSSNSDRAGS